MRPALIAASLALLSLPGLAMAQQRLHPEAAAMCRASCNAEGNAQLGANRARTAQACAIRCDATMAYLASQSHRGSAEATGRGRAPDSTQPSRTTSAQRRTTPPVAQRVSHRTAAPAPRPVAQPAAPIAIPAAARPSVTHGVIYGARTPSAGFGLVVGERDRMAAHRLAERACTSSGPGCRPLAEFTEACGAAAHGVRRSQWALFMTSDPNSYVVTSLSAGSGATQQGAEQQAIAECRSRDPMAVCRITASACAGRG